MSMRIFKTHWFSKWSKKEKILDKALIVAVAEMEQGLVDANLGGFVIKKRVALQGRGKSSGARTIIAYQVKNKAFFIYGFSKNKRANVNAKELLALQALAADLLKYTNLELEVAVKENELIEVNAHE